jgi:hypothetical protein
MIIDIGIDGLGPTVNRHKGGQEVTVRIGVTRSSIEYVMLDTGKAVEILFGRDTGLLGDSASRVCGLWENLENCLEIDNQVTSV